VDFDLRFEPCGDEERDVVALTQAIAASLEGFVRRFPDQWFAFHRVWDEDRPASTEGHERWKHWAILAALKLCRVLPASLSYGLARLAGDVAFWWRSATRRDVEDNMRHVLGENATDEAVRAAAREVFRNVARSYVDLVLLSYKGPRAAFDSLRIEGLEKLTSRLEAGRGVIVTTAHCGNPELAVAVIGASLGIDVLVLVEPLPRSLARVMHRIRSSFGIRYVEVGYTGVAAALRHLRRGGCLAIVSDRDIQDSGAYLTFFGAKARVPLGTVELAARAQVDVLPVFSRRRPGGFDVVFSEPLPLVDSGRPKEDARVNMSALLRRHEEWIRRDPGQWLVLEAIWDGEDAQTPVSAGAGGGPLGPA
jgi:KDO2-lipid IV(A) lauroyltransferase